ncbi:MAG: aspartyl protease family protein [Planctomycetes bacterium]|nr:aspartyl protease family protein [Planctomycetota bacterium]
MRYFVSILLVGFLAASAKPQAAVEAKPVKVPFLLMPSGHFLVSVKVNGKGPYKLIFDTGAPTMLVSNKLAKDLGVNEAKASPFGGFGLPGQATAKSLEIGPLKSENVALMVFDHPTVKAFSDHYEKEHGTIDGIVGFPFFARYKMMVDYQAKELTMTPNGYQPGDVMESMMKMLLGGRETQGKPKIVGASGQWGMIVEKDEKDEEAGVVIKLVRAGSPVEKAGLKVGDRLLMIDGRWTDSLTDTYQAAGYVKAGKAVPVVVVRDGKETKFTVTPAPGL